MGRPKNPQKLLEEALAKGDLEGAKLAMAKMKEKPKAKPKSKKKVIITSFDIDDLPEEDSEGAVLLKIPKKDPVVDPFKVEKSASSTRGIELKTGIKKNKFKPGKECLNKIDKLIIHTEDQGERPPVDITKVKVVCDGCGRKYEAEKWDVNRKMRDPDTKEEYVMENMCVKCIYK